MIKHGWKHAWIIIGIDPDTLGTYPAGCILTKKKCLKEVKDEMVKQFEGRIWNLRPFYGRRFLNGKNKVL